MQAYVYIMAASTDPDVCERSVPYAVDENEVFFGPCKKNLRSDLRKQFLANGSDSAVPDDDIYLVGLNGGNSQTVRKIIWAGRIKRVMTFERNGRRTRTAAASHLVAADRQKPIRAGFMNRRRVAIGDQVVTTESCRNRIRGATCDLPSPDIARSQAQATCPAQAAQPSPGRLNERRVQPVHAAYCLCA